MTVFVEVFEALVVGGIIFYVREELSEAHDSLGNVFIIFVDALVELVVGDFSKL
jgi:hypothetical protein